MKNVLVIGSGGREHAFCWKLQQSRKVSTVYAFPGSEAIAQLEKAKVVGGLNLKDFQGIVSWCLKNNIELVVVGPEDPLADGIADVLTAAGIKCFGPSREGARIEADKAWSKAFMIRHKIATARYESFTNADKAKSFIRNAPFKALVVKASGLAAGKGVIVAGNNDEACDAVDEILGDRKFGVAGEVVVVEELLEGEEVSVLAFVDSKSVRMMLPAQDHKRILDNDLGPNTGGMGAYCPCPLINHKELNMVKEEVLQRAVDGLRSEGISYNGILYAGMMLTPDGPKTLEFNCRAGDPETQVILPLLKNDLFDLMQATSSNNLKNIPALEFESGRSAVGVIMASKGYPETSTKGCVIRGIETVASKEDHLVFHSGTAKNEKSEWITNGGRVLIAVAVGSDLKTAAGLATKACGVINFDGSQYRRDIAKKAFRTLSYKDSGVDIEAGDSLVKRIRPLTRGTNRSGVLGEIGSFGGLFRLNDVKYINKKGVEVTYNDPVLVQGTDGVGTKLKIAEATSIWDTIGQDLVAMCVNDVLCNGAEPLAFLDYIACGHLDVPTAAMIVKGISLACRESNCALIGGETAEMPSMYQEGKYDLAGYCVGVVEHEDILPKINDIHDGDIVIGLPSSGIHSNGFSLVNKIMKESGTSLDEIVPFDDSGRTFAREFLKPTKLYVSEVLPLLRRGHIKALAHITGGGLLENIPRVLSEKLGVQLDAVTWSIPPVFGWLAAKGNVDDQEMLRTFNCGLGMILILPRGEIEWEKMPEARLIGNVVNRDAKTPQVQVRNFAIAIGKLSEPWLDKISVSAPRISYKDSGVDICAGDDLVQNIKPHAKSTNRAGVMGSLGSFGGLFRLRDLKKTYEDPVLVLGTDGVGTKLKIAQQMKKHETVGIDLVAMCANDILCNGAEPLTFLDYYACGHLDVGVATNVVSGIAEGCRQSGSALLGGETAEMPGMYEKDVYDLAGFALGITEYKQILPKRDLINVGDIIIGLSSSGVHSNGFSLIRKVIELSGLKMEDVAPFSASGKSLGEELLVPTKMYVRDILPALETGRIKAMAHITGGGLWENIPRILPAHLTAELDGKLINIHPIFGWLRATGNIEKLELMKTFNCGLGMILVASPADELALMKSLHGSGAAVIGNIVPTKPGGHQLVVRHFATCIDRVERLLDTPKKRVGVLISGSGSNLQALIDATKNTAMGSCAEIVHVISNKADVFGLERARKVGIPCTVISNKDFPSREKFDEGLHSELLKQKVEIVCLAGFMRILTPGFVQKWKGSLINIHPSLLPKFKGIHAQKDALESGDKETGCTVHFVDENVDTGAIIVQEIVPIHEKDTVDVLSDRILKSEHIAFPKALRLVASGYVKLNDNGNTEWV